MTLKTLTRRDEARPRVSVLTDSLHNCWPVTLQQICWIHVTFPSGKANWKHLWRPGCYAHKKSAAKLFSGLVGSLFFLLWFIKRFLKRSGKMLKLAYKITGRQGSTSVTSQLTGDVHLLYTHWPEPGNSTDLASFHWTVNFTINSWQWPSSQDKTRSLVSGPAIKSCSDF